MRKTNYGINLIRRIDFNKLSKSIGSYAVNKTVNKKDSDSLSKGDKEANKLRILYIPENGSHDIPKKLSDIGAKINAEISSHAFGRFDLIIIPVLSKILLQRYGQPGLPLDDSVISEISEISNDESNSDDTLSSLSSLSQDSLKEDTKMLFLFFKYFLMHLSEGGRLVLGMENAAAFWTLAGQDNDPDFHRVSLKDLDILRDSIKADGELRHLKGSSSLFFPMPCLEEPIRLYSYKETIPLRNNNSMTDGNAEKSIAGMSVSKNNKMEIKSKNATRQQQDDEKKMEAGKRRTYSFIENEEPEYCTLFNEGEFPALAPSFIYVYVNSKSTGRKNNFSFIIKKPIPDLLSATEKEGQVNVSKSEITDENLERLEKIVTRNDFVLKEMDQEMYADDIILKRMREESRLTGNHISNLENIMKKQEKRIKDLLEEFEYYKANISTRVLMRSKREETTAKLMKLMPPASSRKMKLLSYARDSFIHPVKTIPWLLSSKGQDSIKGNLRVSSEYPLYGKLKMKRSSHPRLSIIVPCRDNVSFTYRILRLIKEGTDFEKLPYEIILADDLSEDATREIQQYAENMIVMRNRERTGFIRNAQHAAKIAKGDYLVFINPTAILNKGFIETMVNILEENDEIGMLGPKLINGDGRIISAGGIVWADGRITYYKSGADVEDREVIYKKYVDFVAEDCFVIRGDLFRSFGGFDTSLADEGCGMADLGLSVWKAGKKVLYLPKIQLTFENILPLHEDVDEKKVPRFLKKRGEELESQANPYFGQPDLHKNIMSGGIENSRNPLRAKERGTGKTYILVIDHHVPTWDQDAGSKTTLQYIKLLVNHGFIVKFLGDDFEGPKPYTTILQEMGVEVLYGNEMKSNVWKWIDKNSELLDIAFLHRPYTALKYIYYFKEHTKLKIIFYGHDLHQLRTMRAYEASGDPELLEDSLYWKFQEMEVLRRADMSYYPSEIEVNELKRLDPSLPVKAILPYIYENEVDICKDFSERKNLLFVGGFGHPPNKDGLFWFIREILPLVRSLLPSVRLIVAGSHADKEVLSLNKRNDVNILGYVSDERLHELYQSCRLVVVPLRYGAGVKGKVVDAMHEGAAIISTSIGAEGIAEAKNAMIIRDDPQAFADEIVRLYPQTELLKSISQQAADLVKKHYGKEAAWDRIKDDFK